MDVVPAEARQPTRLVDYAFTTLFLYAGTALFSELPRRDPATVIHDQRDMYCNGIWTQIAEVDLLGMKGVYPIVMTGSGTSIKPCIQGYANASNIRLRGTNSPRTAHVQSVPAREPSRVNSSSTCCRRGCLRLGDALVLTMGPGTGSTLQSHRPALMRRVLHMRWCVREG
ncbi:hypothetical protein FA95DRAFT_1576570 [Auriscalpium vulgare]|uniref:Uncharacterized protein n=1 Tax=Auriscalpium vulgare TaxID=40419 RepID=A0ACB8RAB6_9AGAM|nr:hypothetical protein FA95DRAFT_1576570 [Auriscalpium vulgare]